MDFRTVLLTIKADDPVLAAVLLQERQNDRVVAPASRRLNSRAVLGFIAFPDTPDTAQRNGQEELGI